MKKAIRLDKFLADSRVGTRSEVKKMIKDHMVTVNGIPAKDAGQKISPDEDDIRVSGEKIDYSEYQYLMFHKPAGCVTAHTDNLHKTVMDFIPENLHKELSPVGRLDLDTEGFLLITDDGMLAHNLLAPGKHVPKTYFAKICGVVTEKEIQLFAEGISIGDDKPTEPAKLEILSSDRTHGRSEILLTITEGRFHQVKRMFRAVGMEVTYLKRISMGALVLDDDLSPGEWRFLTPEEVALLKNNPVT